MADARGIPYAVTLQWDGFIECGLDLLALCAVPNFVNQTTCSNAQVCPGPFTNDEFSHYHRVDGVPTYIQVEMAWESTQSISQTFSLLLRAGTKESYDAGMYEFSVNRTTGPSPLMASANAKDIEDADIGNTTGLETDIFSGVAGGNPAPTGGFVIEQRFSVFVNLFYGYLPPADWRFVDTGIVPPPS